MSKGWYIGLYETTGIMARPWVEAGYDALCIDILNEPGFRDGIHWRNDDLRDGFALPEECAPVVFLASFSPCDDVAVCGARWFASKGPRALGNAICMFATGLEAGETSGAPYMCENPVGVLSSHVRKPDHTFHPWEYAGWCEADNYTKRTCLWTGGGFIMPPKHPGTRPPDNRIHRAAPGPERKAFRSATPAGFARAVFEANATHPAPPTSSKALHPHRKTARAVGAQQAPNFQRQTAATVPAHL